MRIAGEANEARHRPHLPSLVGASTVNCDCKRNGFTSGAHRRGGRGSFCEGVGSRFVLACLAGGCDSLLLSLLLPDEQPASIQSSARQGTTIFLMRSSAVSSWQLAISN